MSEPLDVFLGFDPGGEGRFGWSICQTDAAGGQLNVTVTGLVSNAREAVDPVEKELAFRNLPRENVRAAGIDAPLFWTSTGFTDIDDEIRKNVKQAGCKTPGGTVQAINSLRSSCSVQGVLLAYHLNHEFELSITEAHPKALDWLDKTMRGSIISLPPDQSEHQRDATFAAYAAWHIGAPGWRNLVEDEPTPNLFPLGTPVSYWMPIPQ